MKTPKNLGLKLISVFFAVVLSYFVNSEGGASVVLASFPIEFQNIPDRRILVSATAKQVDLTISGPSFIVSKVLADSRSLKVRIPAGVTDRYVFEVDSSQLGLPPSVNVVNMEPHRVEVTFDERESKEIPIVVPSIGSVGMNYRISELTITPSVVTVTGPKQELATLSRVETYPIDLRGITSAVNEELRIRSPGSMFTISTPSAKVLIQVRPVERERRFSRIPIQTRGTPPGGLVITPSNASVVISGPSELVQKLDPATIIPYIIAGPESSGAVKVLVDPPDGTTLSIIEPESVSVSFSHPKVSLGKGKH